MYYFKLNLMGLLLGFFVFELGFLLPVSINPNNQVFALVVVMCCTGTWLSHIAKHLKSKTIKQVLQGTAMIMFPGLASNLVLLIPTSSLGIEIGTSMWDSLYPPIVLSLVTTLGHLYITRKFDNE